MSSLALLFDRSSAIPFGRAGGAARLAVMSFTAILVFSSVAPAQEGRSVHGVTAGDELLYAPGFPHFRYANPHAPKGGHITVGRLGPYETLNPFYPRGKAAREIISLTFLPLGAFPNDDVHAGYGVIARDFELSPLGDRMAVNLRDEAVWHDGSPITAEDVVFTVEILSKHGYPSFRDSFKDVISVTAETPKRAVFRFKDGRNPLLPTYVAGLTVLSRAYYSTHRFDAQTSEPPLGNGPYRATAYDDLGRRLSFERIREHWSEKLPTQAGFFNFDRVSVETYRDATVLFEALKAGDVDLFWETNATRWHRGYDFPAARDGRVKRLESADEGALWPMAIVFNLRLDKFKDRRVREALALMIPFRQINESYFWGDADRMDSVFYGSSDLSARGTLPDAAELAILEPLRASIPREVFEKPFAADDASDNLRANAWRAIGLLREAGYDVVPVRSGLPNAGRMVHKSTGRPFEFDFIFTAPHAEREVLLYKQYLARIGIVLNPILVDPARREDLVKRFAFEAQFSHMPGNEHPGPFYRNLVGSESANVPNTHNLPGIADPAVDAIVDAMIAAKSRRERAAAARALDRVLLWNRYYLPAWEVRKTRLAYRDRFGWSPGMVRARFDPVIEWWAKR